MNRFIGVLIILLAIGCGRNKSQMASSKGDNSSINVNVYEESRRVGIEAYNEQRYEYALQCFTSVEKIAPSENDLKLWIEKCKKILIPSDYVLIPGGILNVSEWNSKTEKEINYDLKIDSFYICIYELTQKEYETIVGKIDRSNYSFSIENFVDGKTVEVKGDSIPVIGTYNEFVKYCIEKNKQEGYDGFYEIDGKNVIVRNNGNGYRLLSKYEWEYTAKKGNYYKGNKLIDVAWYGRNSNNRPHKVGLKKPNALGIFDMFGNVSEMLQNDNSYPGYQCFGGGDYMDWQYHTNVLWKSGRIGTRIAFVPR